MERFTAGIPIRDILVEHDNWARFQAANRGRIRPVVCENIRRMLACRTPALGFHVYACPECGEERVVPHSCKSRTCSSCGKVASDRWASAVLNDSLDVAYHHLVFSVPWQFRVVALVNRKVMLNILFRSAADAVMDWCKRYKRFRPGLIAVMHTFGADLEFHPHVHVLVTAGGLSTDSERWVSLGHGYLMVRHYGIFATRIRGTALPRVRALLGREEPTRQDAPTWRERWAARTGIDPLVCPRCGVEMVFIEHGFGPHAGLYARLGLAPGERIEYLDTG